MFEELPPEIPGPDQFPLPLHLDNQGKYLISPERPLDLRLCVADHIIAFRRLPVYPMHHVLSAVPLIEDHIASAQLPLRFCKIDVISVMAQKRRHTASGNQHGHSLSLFRNSPENGYIFICIDYTSIHNISPLHRTAVPAASTMDQISEVHGHAARLFLTEFCHLCLHDTVHSLTQIEHARPVGRHNACLVRMLLHDVAQHSAFRGHVKG